MADTANELELLADSPAFFERMRAFFARVDAAVAEKTPVCTNRGLCCRFGEFGHRLYVTRLELAWFIGRQRPFGLRPATSADACPYQLNGLCTAREHRPLGCRIFFCDPASRDWQGPMYEEFLAELKGIGAEFGIPYQFGDWLDALRSVDSPAAESLVF